MPSLMLGEQCNAHEDKTSPPPVYRGSQSVRCCQRQAGQRTGEVTECESQSEVLRRDRELRLPP